MRNLISIALLVFSSSMAGVTFAADGNTSKWDVNDTLGLPGSPKVIAFDPRSDVHRPSGSANINRDSADFLVGLPGTPREVMFHPPSRGSDATDRLRARSAPADPHAGLGLPGSPMNVEFSPRAFAQAKEVARTEELSQAVSRDAGASTVQ